MSDENPTRTNEQTHDQPQRVDSRRALLKKFGTGATYVAPATLLLLSSKAATVS